MLGPTQQLLAYYIGGVLVVVLLWAAAHPNSQLDPDDARRYLRWTTATAIAGLAHPAIALAARDIVDQIGVDLPDDDTDLTRAKITTNALLAVSLLPAAALTIATIVT